MKRKIIFFLSVVVIACMIINVALADSWICPDCGATNTGNYCSNCGTKKPTSSSSNTISNVQFSFEDNGDVIVTWDDSSSASSYTVEYTTDDWDCYYTVSGSITRQRANMKYLVPGLTYNITISNGSSEITKTYTVPRPIFTEYEAGDKYMDLTENRYSISEMEDNPSMTFQVQIKYPKLRYSREYTAKLVLNTPYGYSSTVHRWDSYTFENQYTYVYSTFSMMSEWLDQVEDDFGSIPTGEYTFEMYMDGQLYSYESFTVTY